MYGDVVADLGGERFEDALDRLKDDRGVKQDVELTADDLKGLVARFLVLYREGAGEDFPQDPRVQLERSVSAVFDSWETPRAQVYRRAHAIPDDLGTAVNIVQMVFGNRGESSGTGVCFTRDPSTGEPGVWGEFLANAQGEDVVAGIRTPEPIARHGHGAPGGVRRAGRHASAGSRQHYREMQDVEFTVEEERLYILQTRGGKRTAGAALRIATDMVDEGLISREDAIARIEASQLDQLLHPMIDPKATYDVAAKGLNASPGAAKGKIALDADTAEEWGKAGEDVILVRRETTPDDIHGLIQASGVLTAHGGMTSHAAVVARGMGKPCVAGCEALKVDLGSRTITIGEAKLSEGDRLTIDGGTGEVILADVELVPPQINEHFETILGWADEVRRLKVRANADTPEDAAKAREFGAQGIGLCRTEHMFMAEDRLPLVRAMIMASSDAERGEVLAKLLPLQQSDFEGIFEAMAGLPVTIRLLDPPLHEFLPPLEEAETPEMAARIRSLTEANPMLGTRGCRLGLLYPEIYAMQVRAIIRAALAVEEKTGRRAARRDHASARRLRRGAPSAARADARHRVGRAGAGRARDRLPGRHDDRAAAGLPARRRDRRAGRLLLLRDERPDADDARLLPRRRGGRVPDALPGGRRARGEPVLDARPERRRRPDEDRDRARPHGEARHQARHLRRARRRPGVGRRSATASASTT